jgi:lipopolysaccharide/colanic/teichoic acid biosynthesis glycosyltransferase
MGEVDRGRPLGHERTRDEGEQAPLTHGARERFAKRALDLCIALPALLVLLPVIGVVAIGVGVTQGRPILFRQRRPGLAGAPFTILKFRTMREVRAGEDPHRTDEARVTPLGRLLRRTSLDELPELWNVVRGEMSLVGPRPLLMEYLETYGPRQARRHEMRPGVTSWAIVQGRHSLGFAERLELDVWYVEHWSLRLDIRILWMTAAQMLHPGRVAVTQDIDEIGFPLPFDSSEGRQRSPGLRDADSGSAAEPTSGSGTPV